MRRGACPRVERSGCDGGSPGRMRARVRPGAVGAPALV